MEVLGTLWGFASIAMICIAIVIIVWRVGSFSLTKSGILIGKSKKVSPHMNCPHAGAIMDMIHRTTEYIENRQNIKTTLLEEQMRFYEETEEEVLSYMKKIFLKLLIAKLDDMEAYVQHAEYSAYIVTLKAISADLKSYIRVCFKANHYAECNTEIQREYVNKKKAVIIGKITEALNLYWRGSFVTRGELYKEHQEHTEAFESFIESVFNKAFHLARDTKNELDKEERVYKAYLSDIFGTEDI